MSLRFGPTSTLPQDLAGHYLIEKLIMTPITLARFLSLAELKSTFGEAGAHIFIDLYVLLLAILLTCLLFLPSHWGRFGVFFAAYCVADIVSYRIYFLLVKSQQQPWIRESLRRSLVMGVLNFYETIVGYAVLYLTVGHIVVTTTRSPQLAPTTALYFSTVTATTLGLGDYIPADTFTQVLVITQLLNTMLFLLFIIPALVSVYASEKADTE